MLSVRISSFGCMQEVWRAWEKWRVARGAPKCIYNSICARYNIAKWNLRREGQKPWWKMGRNHWLNIHARECDASTVLNKIMDARLR